MYTSWWHCQQEKTWGKTPHWCCEVNKPQGDCAPCHRDLVALKYTVVQGWFNNCTLMRKEWANILWIRGIRSFQFFKKRSNIRWIATFLLCLMVVPWMSIGMSLEWEWDNQSRINLFCRGSNLRQICWTRSMSHRVHNVVCPSLHYKELCNMAKDTHTQTPLHSTHVAS